MKRLTLVAVLLSAVLCCAQPPRSTASGSITTSGGAINLQNPIGALNATFEILLTGAPTSSTIATSGCMRGGTCETVDSYTGNVNAVRQPVLSKVYDFFQVTATLAGGTSPAVQINATLSTAALNSNGATPFNCNVTLSTNTTTQLTGCGVPAAGLRLYVTDFQLNTTTAGTATTIALKYGTGSNCGTGTASLSAITYPNTAVGVTNVFGARMPLIPAAGNAICATQAGTTAGTTVVEVRGYTAP